MNPGSNGLGRLRWVYGEDLQTVVGYMVPGGETPYLSVAPSAVALPAAGEIPLPTIVPIALPSGATRGCADIGLANGVLHGNPTDPHVAWVTTNGPNRVEVTWPSGYRARFSPELEVLDASGQVVAREGDPIAGGCVGPDSLELYPPFH